MSAITSTASSGTKRKRESEMKFYAVRAGHKPGVYHSWADCKQQITGFKGAVYKSFTSLTDASAFASGSDPVRSSNATPKKYYAVRSGRVPGVYTDWASAQKQLTGPVNPKHKSFSTRAEAEAFVEQQLDEATPEAVFGSTEPDSLPTKKAKTPKTKAAAPMPSGPGFDWLGVDNEDGFDQNIILDPETGMIRYKTAEERNATKLMPKTDHFGETLHIWTDGACLANGRPEAVAGVGIWFGPNDPRNFHEPLLGKRQTNQRAELTALKRALDHSPLNRDVRIHSDSKYAISCVTEWFQKWRANNWINTAGKSVDNQDLIKEILAIIENRSLCRAKTQFEWVKGHAVSVGNNGADELAVRGAQESRAKGLNGVRAAGGELDMN